MCGTSFRASMHAFTHLAHIICALPLVAVASMWDSVSEARSLISRMSRTATMCVTCQKECLQKNHSYGHQLLSGLRKKRSQIKVVNVQAEAAWLGCGAQYCSCKMRAEEIPSSRICQPPVPRHPVSISAIESKPGCLKRQLRHSARGKRCKRRTTLLSLLLLMPLTKTLAAYSHNRPL